MLSIKNFAPMAVTALLCLFVTTLFAQTLTKPQIQKLYLDYLASEGFKGEVDADGDVGFKFEGSSYYLVVNPDDQEFFRAMSSEVFSISNYDERRKAEAACSYASGKIKCAKAFISNDKVRFSVELFVNKPQDFKGNVFTRSLRAIQSVRKTFLERMNE